MRNFPYLSNKYTVEGEVGRRNCYQQTSGRDLALVGRIFLSLTPGCGRISFVAVLENMRESFGANLLL